MAEGDTDQHSSGSSHLSSAPSLLGENVDNMDTECEYPLWGEDAQTNWQERCVELELSLQKFRDQASKIRTLLREKEDLVNGLYLKTSSEGNIGNCQHMLSELEHRVIEAETRAEDAEEKVRMMEQKLSETKWTPTETHDRYNQLQNTVKEKDRLINQLETQVEEQKQMRLNDAKQVEAKAARIKEWVTNKLKELENQNLHLREQNQKCNQQLELLRNRFQHLSTSPASGNRSRVKVRDKAEQRTSTEDSSRGSFEEPGDSEESFALQAQHQQQQQQSSFNTASTTLVGVAESSSSDSTHASSTIFEQGDSDSDPVYAEVDPTKKKSSSGKQTIPPRIRIERKKYQENHVSMLSSTPSSEGDGSAPPLRTVDSHVDSASSTVDVDSKTSSAHIAPATASKSEYSTPTKKHKSDSKKKPVPPPRSRVPKRGMDSGGSSLQPSFEESGRTSPAAGSEMYDSFVEEIISSLNSSRTQGVNLRLARTADEDEMHDYAEIYTPSKERGPQWNADGQQDLNKPPTPPLHRFPSWESRIYEIASSGMNVSEKVIDNAHQESTGTKCATYTNGGQPYCEINVPVYATVKGRASQIRSFPFTGDSSDSSDNEDVRVTMTTNSSHTTSGETDSSLSTSSPSKSLKTASSPSPAKQSASPTKCIKRSDISKDFCSPDSHYPLDTPVDSAVSDDYAVPPDAISSDALSIDSAFDSPLVKCSSQDSPKKESLEKSGYLTKLGGKLKTWRKRWFVLKNGTLVYFKSQSDSNRKPQGQITLDEVCRVTRTEGSATFEITTGKKTFYLTADSSATMEEWVRVLQNVLRRNATKLLLSKEDNKSTIQGWLVKVKHGHSKRCWCVLVGKMFLYFKSPNDMTPIGQLNMRDARVEEVEHMSDSDEEDREPEDCAKRDGEFTIGIFPNHQGPTYLLFPSKQEKDTWLYHLTVVSSGVSHVGTQYEQLIQRLMEMDGDPNCVIWKHPLLLYSKENITHPLTTLPSEQLQVEAVKLFKSCQLFMSVLVDSAGIDYHVVLAQNALQQCLTTPELQNEVFCQLIKQTSRHTQQKIGMQQLLLCATQSLFLCDSSGAEKTSPTSNLTERLPPPPDCKMNPANFVFIQGWQLLALAISLFLPKNNRLLWYLKLHLERNADSKTEIGKYAIFCQRALERTKQNGCREVKPSRMEVLSILLKNPYHHSLPHSIPVHFLNGTYQVVGFDGSSTLEEFTQTLNLEIGVRDTMYSGFALFSDDPINTSVEHYLQPEAKLADVISKWETALRENKLGKFENTKVVKLTYKNRLYFRNYIKSETEKERLLFVVQANEDVNLGRFPVSKELALELATLMAQIEFGDYNDRAGRGSGGTPPNPHHQMQHVLDRFYPRRYKEGLNADELKQLSEMVTEKWSGLRGRSLLDCVRIYLTCVRKWPYFGAKLFPAKLKTSDQSSMWLAVTDDSISLLDSSTMQAARRFSYPSLVTFGGCRDDFMLVVGQSDNNDKVDQQQTAENEKFLFSMSKPQILELTLLTADYTNALHRPQVPPPTPQTGTLTRPDSRLRSRAPDIVRMATEAESKLQRSDSRKQRTIETRGTTADIV